MQEVLLEILQEVQALLGVLQLQEVLLQVERVSLTNGPRHVGVQGVFALLRNPVLGFDDFDSCIALPAQRRAE